MLSHRDLVANAEQSRGLLNVSADDRLLALLPFFHMYGLTVLLNLALRQRARLVTMPKFDLAEFLRIIQDHKCSNLFIAPPVAVALSAGQGTRRQASRTLSTPTATCTGDIATVRADGVVTIADRLKELIKYKGYQIAPAELEALLLTHPGIADAAVIGTPDADGQEVPMAFVVRQPGDDGARLDEAAVMDFVAAKVAPFKKIRRVEFIEAVPKSSSGKILRRILKTAPAAAGGKA